MNEKNLNKNTKAQLIKMLIAANSEATALQITRENEEATYKANLEHGIEVVRVLREEFKAIKGKAAEHKAYVDAVNTYNELPFNKRWTTSFPVTPKS